MVQPLNSYQDKSELTMLSMIRSMYGGACHGMEKEIRREGAMQSEGAGREPSSTVASGSMLGWHFSPGVWCKCSVPRSPRDPGVRVAGRCDHPRGTACRDRGAPARSNSRLPTAQGRTLPTC